MRLAKLGIATVGFGLVDMVGFVDTVGGLGLVGLVPGGLFELKKEDCCTEVQNRA